MIQIREGFSSVILVIHEIYGVNEHMKETCIRLAGQGYDVICPNLLKRDEPFDYNEEHLAYQHFMNTVGFENGLEKIKQYCLKLRESYQHVFVVGFSVGATIAWLLSEEKVVDRVVCYYGSRIRDYVEVSPKCPTMLFFPQKESSFKVDELISLLNQKSITIEKFNANHGFNDSFSQDFDSTSANEAFNKTIQFFNKT